MVCNWEVSGMYQVCTLYLLGLQIKCTRWVSNKYAVLSHWAVLFITTRWFLTGLTPMRSSPAFFLEIAVVKTKTIWVMGWISASAQCELCFNWRTWCVKLLLSFLICLRRRRLLIFSCLQVSLLRPRGFQVGAVTPLAPSCLPCFLFCSAPLLWRRKIALSVCHLS